MDTNTIFTLNKYDLQEERRKGGGPRGFAASLRRESILQSLAAQTEFDFSSVAQEAKAVILRTAGEETAKVRVLVGEEGAKDFVEMVPSTMEVEEDLEEDMSEGSEAEGGVEITAERTRAEVLEEKVTERIDLAEDSEEETMTLASVP